MHALSLSLSAVRPSPLSAGSLTSYPVTASPFGSSPGLSFIEDDPSSPDLFEPFEYTPDMAPDFHRIDSEVGALQSEDGNTQPSSSPQVLVPDTPPRTPPQDQDTWVVFLGKVPGVYNTPCVPSFIIDV